MREQEYKCVIKDLVSKLYFVSDTFIEPKMTLFFSMHGSRGVDRVSRPPLKDHKNKRFLSNIGPGPLKITKLPSQIQCWGIIGTPAKRHLNGISMAGR